MILFTVSFTTLVHTTLWEAFPLKLLTGAFARWARTDPQMKMPRIPSLLVHVSQIGAKANWLLSPGCATSYTTATTPHARNGRSSLEPVPTIPKTIGIIIAPHRFCPLVFHCDIVASLMVRVCTISIRSIAALFSVQCQSKIEESDKMRRHQQMFRQEFVPGQT